MAKQVWFITGASSGFGRAFAEYALEQGHSVVVGARRVEKLQEIERIAPDRVLALAMDVTNAAQVAKATAEALIRFRRIDVLINNAGYGIVGAIEETPENELRALMETNFFGAIAVTRALLPAFRAQRGGAIVNISSLGGRLSFAGFGAYSASKFALEGASEALAQEMKPFGVKVLIVEPGQFRTDLAGDAMKHMPELEAYKESSGTTRAFAASMHHTQAGDPRKAARAIDLALQSANTPLRLQLGADAIDMVRQHAESLLGDLAEWERVARDTAF
jgi:NAD(P)-dependent dehydrogenase (short-subunit alcohol dehydrogenase family)